MNISDIQTGIRDRYGQVPSSKLNRFIASAVKTYSSYNPRVVRGEVTTVVDQQTYSLASFTGITGVRHVLWSSDETLIVTDIEDVDELYYVTQPHRYSKWSQFVIDDIEQQEWNKRVTGYAYYLKATNELYLADEPSTSETITVVYYAEHVINDTGDAYETIPADDEDLIRDLVLADLYEVDSFELAMQPDYKEGQESETFSKISGNVATVVDRLRARLPMKYGNSVIDVGP